MFRPVVCLALLHARGRALSTRWWSCPRSARAVLTARPTRRSRGFIRRLRYVRTRPRSSFVLAPSSGVAIGAAARARGRAPRDRRASMGAEFLPRIFEGAYAHRRASPAEHDAEPGDRAARRCRAGAQGSPRGRDGREPHRPTRRRRRLGGARVERLLRDPQAARAVASGDDARETRAGALGQAPRGGVSRRRSTRFSQPIEMRVNDLIAGMKSDLRRQDFYGDDLADHEPGGGQGTPRPLSGPRLQRREDGDRRPGSPRCASPSTARGRPGSVFSRATCSTCSP